MTKNLTTFNETKGNDDRTNDTMEDSELEQIRANRMAQMGAQVRPNSINSNRYCIISGFFPTDFRLTRGIFTNGKVKKYQTQGIFKISPTTRMDLSP